MKKICPVCGRKEHLGVKVSGGEKICYMCSNLSPNHSFENVEKLREYHNIQCERRSAFSKTNVLKNLGTIAIVIDEKNKLFYYGKEKNDTPIIYRFDEVTGYEIEYDQAQTVTKKKGGVGRAVVGGAIFGVAGAVVGASTAKEVTTQQGGPFHINIYLHSFAGDITCKIYTPPFKIDPFLEMCVNESKKLELTSIENTVQTSDADEILKFKNLLDAGVITQEEFEAKKKQLLGL